MKAYEPGDRTHTGEIWMTPVWQLTLAERKGVVSWRGVGDPPAEVEGVRVIDMVQVV